MAGRIVIGGDVRYARISKSGGARTIAVPREFREALGWEEGAVVELWLQGDCLVAHRAIKSRDLLTPDLLGRPARDAGGKDAGD